MPHQPQGLDARFTISLGLYLNEIALSTGYTFINKDNCDVSKRMPISGFTGMDSYSHLKDIGIKLKDYEIIIMATKPKERKIILTCKNK